MSEGSLILVRVRGTVNLSVRMADTLDMLRLQRPNHAVVIPKTPSYMGMVNRIKDYVAYGDADAGTLAEMLRTRGKVKGDKALTDAFVNDATAGKHATIDAFAQALASGEATLKDLGEDYKPWFRLHPPTGGHVGSTKRHYTVKGELGYRGKDINALVRRMI